PVFGAKHPDALGLPGSRAWSEIWDTQLHELLAGVVRTGEAFWAKDLLFDLERYGFAEETYFDVSYDPVRVESGAVGGVFCIVTETTERVVGERRLALLRDLATKNANARSERDACLLAVGALEQRLDISFAQVHLNGELQAQTQDAERALQQATPESVKRFALPSAGGPPGQLVVGINPRRPYDEHYSAFLKLVADHERIAVGIAKWAAVALENARLYKGVQE